MRKNKWKSISIVIIAYSIIITIIYMFIIKNNANPIQKKISKIIDMSVEEQFITAYKSTAGFFGDGITYIEIALDNDEREDVKELLQNSDLWEKLPCPKVLEQPVYDSKFFERAGHDYEGLFPNIDNGWYYFYDKQTGDLDSKVRVDIWNRNSHNYIYAVYDIDNGILYYYEYDS